jgi:hypothetical protein
MFLSRRCDPLCRRFTRLIAARDKGCFKIYFVADCEMKMRGKRDGLARAKAGIWTSWFYLGLVRKSFLFRESQSIPLIRNQAKGNKSTPGGWFL